MDLIQYIFRFLYRIRWWLIIAPALVTLAVIWKTRNMPRNYKSDMTIFTGVVSGYTPETNGLFYNPTIVNNTVDNIINIMKSKETLREVCLHLYARHMIYGDPQNDNTYIKAENYQQVYTITPKDVLTLIDKSSEQKTVENLKRYEVQSPQNFVYGLFNWNHPYYCYNSLDNIKVQRLGNSDMLNVSYASSDPGVAYQTLLLLDSIYVDQYKRLQFGSTESAIRYFEEELVRVGEELKTGEDSLTQYNASNRIIDYTEQAKGVAVLDQEIEIQYQGVLQKYQSAEASIKQLETLLGENAVSIKNNAMFLSKLAEISNLNKSISELESFHKEEGESPDNSKLQKYKAQLKTLEKDFTSLSSTINANKYSKEGLSSSNIASIWMEELLNLEKLKAEKSAIEEYRAEIDQKYTLLSPIGSTIKRKERNINFIENSYLTILGNLNDAKLRLKSLEMNSASLKVINPATFPLNADPSKRKSYVLAAFAGSFVFILGFFLLLDLFNFTLRDKVHTERITGGKVLGAFPLIGKGKYDKAREEKATQYLGNALAGYFQSTQPTIINLISISQKTGKTFLSNQLADLWEEQGLNIQSLEWGTDFSPFQKEFMLSRRLFDLTSPVGANIYIVEHAALSLNSIPSSLLQEAAINLLVIKTDYVWKEKDKILFCRLQEQCGKAPLLIYLNQTTAEVTESFTGLLPPYTRSKLRALLLAKK